VWHAKREYPSVYFDFFVKWANAAGLRPESANTHFQFLGQWNTTFYTSPEIKLILEFNDPDSCQDRRHLRRDRAFFLVYFVAFTPNRFSRESSTLSFVSNFHQSGPRSCVGCSQHIMQPRIIKFSFCHEFPI
jgi:hypothetical protein